MTKKRFELIGFLPEVSTDEIEEATNEDMKCIGDYNPNYDGRVVRANYVHSGLNDAVIGQLEILVSLDVAPHIEDGSRNTVDLFWGDWWKTDKFWNSREEIDVNFRRFFDPFSKGLLLLMLADRWDDATHLGNWLTDDRLESSHGVDKEIVAVYFLIAEHLRATPFENSAAIRERAEKCRSKKPRLLLAVWDAAVSADQEAFDKAIKASLQYHAKSVKKTGIGFDFTGLIAQPESVICLWAMHKGMKFPKLREKLAAYLITPESLGLRE